MKGNARAKRKPPESRKRSPARLVESVKSDTILEKAGATQTGLDRILKVILDHTHMLVAYLDRQFNFIWVNRSYAEADDKEPSFFPGKNHFDLYPNDENEKIFRRVVEIGKPYYTYAKPFEYAEHPERGVSYWDWSLIPIKDEHGAVTGLVLTIANVTERKEAEEEYMTIISTAMDGFWVVDTQGRFLDVNNAYCNLIGYSREELLSMKVSDVEVAEKPQEIERHIQNVMRVGADRFETQHRCKDGRIVDIEVSANFMQKKDGRFIVFLRDISHRKLAQEALKHSEERYALAQRAANIGSWDWNIESGYLQWSETIEPLFGFNPGEFSRTYEAFLECVHPDDRQFVVASVNACINEGKDYDIEHRIIWPDGTVRWVSETGNVIRNQNNEAVRMLGIVRDITEEKEAEEHRLIEAQMKATLVELNQIVSLFDSINTGVILIGADGIVEYTNGRARDILMIEKGENVNDYLNLNLRVEEEFVNEIVYSKKVKQSLLVTRKKYKERYLFLFELIRDELKKNRKLRTTLAPYDFDDIVGLEEVKRKARDIAIQNVNMLLLGESGTGKELFASAIHNASPRAGCKFVAINCGAIPETLFESELFGYKKGAFTDARTDHIGKIEYASGGTVFFDEIGDLPLYVQSKFLRVLEDKCVVPLGGHEPVRVDVRFIFATNQDLNEMIAKRQFREDLFYRINLPVIKIPPLRERKGELIDLINHFIVKFRNVYKKFTSGISKEALEYLMAYDYPGNVRELEGILKNAYLTCRSEKVGVVDLRLDSISKISINEKVQEYRAKFVYECFLVQNKDVEKTAEVLGLSTRQVYRYLRKMKKQ